MQTSDLLLVRSPTGRTAAPSAECARRTTTFHPRRSKIAPRSTLSGSLQTFDVGNALFDRIGVRDIAERERTDVLQWGRSSCSRGMWMRGAGGHAYQRTAQRASWVMSGMRPPCVE